MLVDQAVDLPDNYILTLTDSYGDGGGQVTIGDTVYTLDGGSSESFVVGVCAISGCTDAAACNYDSKQMKMMVHVLLQQKDLTVMVTNLIVQETLLRTYHGLVTDIVMTVHLVSI